MSGSRITIADKNPLDNVHPGDILREDFLIGSGISVEEVAAGSGVEQALLQRIVKGGAPVDADTDLRLARYFGVSEGLFLGLQNDFDLEEVRRKRGEELDRIVPRAA